ncbi:MAG: oligosaccharide flippase family protein, partial [Fibrobacterota bacterium]|nr:oligosaccharide flippase family protein [Fibrobacterota bacterium]
MKRIRSLMATDTLRYTGAVVASRIPPFLFLPVYASLLPPEDLGLYLTAMILVDLVQTLSSIGMVQALFRFFPKAAGQSERKAMLGTALMTGAAGGALIFALFMGAFSLPAARESLEATRGMGLRAFVLALIAGGFINMMSILTAYVWAERRTKVFLAAMGTGAVLETG